jgi:hypothetical protein
MLKYQAVMMEVAIKWLTREWMLHYHRQVSTGKSRRLVACQAVILGRGLPLPSSLSKRLPKFLNKLVCGMSSANWSQGNSGFYVTLGDVNYRY